MLLRYVSSFKQWEDCHIRLAVSENIQSIVKTGETISCASNSESDASALYLKVSKGALWSYGGAIFIVGIHFLVLGAIARVLNPGSFGIFALALIVTQFLSEVSELGMQPGIIQAKELSEVELSSCFWLSNIIRGSLAVFVYFAAPAIAYALGSHKLGEVLGVLGLSLIFEGITTLPLAVLQRALRFKEIACIEVGAAATSGALTIVLAFHGLGLWSLVAGAIFQRVVKSALFLFAAAYRPLWAFDLRQIKKLLSFGFNVTGERIVNFFAQRADYLLIGRYLGPSPLGYYSLANEVSTAPQKRFSFIISRVTLPAYSKVQDDNERLATAYLKVVGHVASLTFPILFCLAAVAPEFIWVAFGEKWLPVVPLLRILCALGCLKSVGTLVGALIYAKGRADIGFKWSFVMLSGTAIGLFIGLQWGLVGAAFGYAISFFALVPIIQTIALRLVGQNLLVYFHALSPATFASALGAGTAWIVDSTIIQYCPESFLLALSCALFSGAGVYISAYFFIGRKNIIELFKLGRTLFQAVTVKG